MPTVTRDTPLRRAAAPGPGADPAARVRRIIGSAHEHAAGDLESRDGRVLDRALARFDAPVDLRIRGGLGSGRRTLAAALQTRRGWHPAVDDLDVVAAPGRPAGCPPDVEIVCLRTAPCRHEEAWIRRPRAHPLLVVATGVDDEDRPRWAGGLPGVDARHPSDGSLDPVIAFLDRALDGLGAVRAGRLEAELHRLSVHDEVGDLAEVALCALGASGRP
ncbi:hypothetical protein [Dietzia sp. UBA5065]|uniref:hypothetical protein n=1 Tax=Dietzia sp. UBA5065 TaxID=1946422 RepID=UPI0025C41868|nr:hypothetical protein [Dietzia sp. UBA5065]HMT50286.1 hypothetical protein [Dietzia sp.]